VNDQGEFNQTDEKTGDLHKITSRDSRLEVLNSSAKAELLLGKSSLIETLQRADTALPQSRTRGDVDACRLRRKRRFDE